MKDAITVSTTVGTQTITLEAGLLAQAATTSSRQAARIDRGMATPERCSGGAREPGPARPRERAAALRAREGGPGDRCVKEHPLEA